MNSRPQKEPKPLFYKFNARKAGLIDLPIRGKFDGDLRGILGLLKDNAGRPQSAARHHDTHRYSPRAPW